MADDWVKNYIDIHRQRQQEKENAQKRADLAPIVAPDMFQRIKKRVQRDLQTLHDAGTFQSLHFNDREEEKFSVASRAPRQPAVIVELKTIVIEYTHIFPRKEEEGMSDSDSGILRICSSLEGVARVYRNGSGKAFADESDVSDFLLRPMLDYVDSQ
jgi:hypothetical protein